jgi:DNA (cytosine-5)-methyltransferase 1
MMNDRLGKILKDLRRQKGIGLKQLSKTLGVDRAHLSRIETGKVLPADPLLRRLCRRLGGDIEVLTILSGRLPKDIQDLFAEKPKEVVSYLRRAASLNGNGFVHENGKAYQGQRKYRVADLFCGAGGFTLGLTRTGRFEPVFANDFNRFAVDTYNYNFGDHCIDGDINALLERRDFKLPAADLVIGGPPCQGFSLLNKKREGDPRKELWRAYMQVVERLNPMAFVMENVPELLPSQEFAEVRKMSAKMGYLLDFGVLNAADFGVSQRRRRAIVIGCRVAKPKLPLPTHCNPAKRDDLFKAGLLPWETVHRAIGDLPAPEGIEARVGEVNPPMDLHFGRSPIPSSLQRYRCIPEGGNRFDLQKKRLDLTPKCWIRKKSGGTDLFGRLWWDRPAFTIRTEFFKPEKGRYLHPQQHRPITHREAARLQSFPDDFIFQGTKTEIARQIGNAVPPMLGQRIGECVAAMLDSAGVSTQAETVAA